MLRMINKIGEMAAALLPSPNKGSIIANESVIMILKMEKKMIQPPIFVPLMSASA